MTTDNNKIDYRQYAQAATLQDNEKRANQLRQDNEKLARLRAFMKDVNVGLSQVGLAFKETSDPDDTERGCIKLHGEISSHEDKKNTFEVTLISDRGLIDRLLVPKGYDNLGLNYDTRGEQIDKTVRGIIDIAAAKQMPMNTSDKAAPDNTPSRGADEGIMGQILCRIFGGQQPA